MARIDAAIGQRVRQRRIELGRSPGELARAAGISQYVLEEIETGRQGAGGPLLIDLAAALGVSVAFFFDQG